MKHYLSPTNQIFAYELDGSQDHLIPSNFTSITDAQANAIREQKRQEIVNSMTYAERRVCEYPTFGEQFDKLYHDGYDAWKASIKTVKDKYPKS
jgi:hypothetical protein